MLYSINRLNIIVWFPLLTEIFVNMCNVFACCAGCGTTKFEINFIPLIKPIFYMIKKSRQKFKHVEIVKSL